MNQEKSYYEKYCDSYIEERGMGYLNSLPSENKFNNRKKYQGVVSAAVLEEYEKDCLFERVTNNAANYFLDSYLFCNNNLFYYDLEEYIKMELYVCVSSYLKYNWITMDVFSSKFSVELTVLADLVNQFFELYSDFYENQVCTVTTINDATLNLDLFKECTVCDVEGELLNYVINMDEYPEPPRKIKKI